MTNDYPELSEQQAIARDAEKIFEGLLSSRCWNDVKIPQERDYGLDYRIEAVTDGQLKGCEFLVQLKGTKAVPPGTESVPLSISTATLRYWKRKILPILVVLIDCTARRGYFCWFDKTLEISKQQGTQTIHVSTRDQLDDLKLLFSLEPYYAAFVQELADEAKLRFYQHLFAQVNALSNLLLQTCMQQLFAPANLTASDDGREQLDSHRKRVIDNFITVFIKFIHDLRLYFAAQQSFPLGSNPFDERLASTIGRLFELHDNFAIKSGETPGWGIMMINPERALMSLPEIGSLFSNIQEALRGSLLRSFQGATGQNVFMQPLTTQLRLIDTLFSFFEPHGFCRSDIPLITEQYGDPPLFRKLRGNSNCDPYETSPEVMDIEELLGIYVARNEQITLFADGLRWCAAKLDVHEAELRFVVLVHEIAHWMVHRLPTNKADEFPLEKYEMSAIEFHEALAQLLTYWVGGQVSSSFREVFEKLNTRQSSVYHAYRRFEKTDHAVVINAIVRARTRGRPSTLSLLETDIAQSEAHQPGAPGDAPEAARP